MSALLIVDVQNDFCPGGSLAVPDGNAVVDPINRLISSRKWDLVVATKDWHPPTHISFASNHAGAHPFDTYEVRSAVTDSKVTSVLWPDHCVENSPGAEFSPGLDTSRVDHVVLKGQTSEFYSAFADVLKETPTELNRLLQDHSIKEVVVVGLAYDYCVAKTALDAANLGYATSIISECTRGISKDTVAAAKSELAGAGVQIL